MGGAVLSGEGGRVCAPLRGSLGGIVLVHVFVVGVAVRTGTGGGFGGVRASVVAVGTVARRADLAADAEERSHGILLLLFLLLRRLPDGGRVRVDGVGGCVCVHLDVSVRVSGFYHHLHRDRRAVTTRGHPPPFRWNAKASALRLRSRRVRGRDTGAECVRASRA